MFVLRFMGEEVGLVKGLWLSGFDARLPAAGRYRCRLCLWFILFF